uniref:MAGE domain-containing protein n=1 Tax=Phocoena sinus TaxID=42100 RepID=A0A8C9CQ14_PHOSS
MLVMNATRPEMRPSCGGAQAIAAAEEESTTTSSPQCGGITQSLPTAGSCSTAQEPQRAPTTTTSAGISYTISDEASNSQHEDRASAYEVPSFTESSGTVLLTRKAGLLEQQFLLYKYKMKQPIMKEDMLKIVHQSYHDRFAEILKRASERTEIVFAVDVKEVDSTSHCYDLVSKLKLPNNGRVRGGRGLPKTGLLMNLLGMIFMKGNCATAEDIWKFLSMMRVYAGRKHFISGEPRKLITKDLVRLKYLEYRQVPNSDPLRYEFLWGPRARAETSKVKVLEFLAKVNDTVPSAFPSYYKEASRDEEEKARAMDAARADTTASGVGVGAVVRASTYEFCGDTNIRSIMENCCYKLLWDCG